MPKYQIVLTNGNKVNLDTDITIGTMKKWQRNGLVSKNLIGNLMLLENTPQDFDSKDMNNAYYLAYLNAKNKTNYTQEEFEELLSYDIGTGGELFSELIGGQKKNKLYKLQESFKQKTTKNDKGGKKHPK